MTHLLMLMDRACPKCRSRMTRVLKGSSASQLINDRTQRGSLFIAGYEYMFVYHERVTWSPGQDYQTLIRYRPRFAMFCGDCRFHFDLTYKMHVFPQRVAYARAREEKER